MHLHGAVPVLRFIHLFVSLVHYVPGSMERRHWWENLTAQGRGRGGMVQISLVSNSKQLDCFLSLEAVSSTSRFRRATRHSMYFRKLQLRQLPAPRTLTRPLFTTLVSRFRPPSASKVGGW